ncbi:MAG: LysM peptidoglycan-binding domain-containing protein [Chitinophagales bacterium]|nr:LysM peptidoglycan-binding domain-containing protein [Chitinophagales bacterium]
MFTNDDKKIVAVNKIELNLKEGRVTGGYIYNTKLVVIKMKNIFIVVCSLIVVNCNAQTVSFSKPLSQQSDTHIVIQGETWYSISKQYKTTVDALLKMNSDCNKNSLPLGKGIHVPIVKEVAVKENKDLGNKKNLENALTHKVMKGETVYAISKKYNTTVEQIKTWNQLNDFALKEGQVLVVGYENPKMNLIGPLPMEESWLVAATVLEEKEKPETESEDTLVAVAEKSSSSVLNSNAAMIRYDEKGIATWTHSTYDEGNFYALHPTAPKGTMITVKNLMNNKMVQVKVIGKLPATGENENVQIKISKSAAKKLNVLDDKFLVKLDYMAPEELIITGTN